MKFTKMQGAGNDFVVINNMEEALSREALPELAKSLCKRRMSIGADGLMVVEKPEKNGDFKMLFFNADGSLGEMCGNGARCIAKYGYEHGLAGDIIKIETTAGLVTGWRLSQREYKVRLNDITHMDTAVSLEACGKTYDCAYVELGNPAIPHLVVPLQGLQSLDPKNLWNLGSALRHHPSLSKGANVNFYEIIGEDLVYERTFERGVEDFTYACGTGTGSVVSVLTKKGLVSGKQVKVLMEGGALYINVVQKGDEITDLYLTGPAVIVAEGEIGEVLK